AAYRAAIATDPKFVWPHNNLGNILRTMGDLKGAIAAYRAAIAIDPNLALPRRNLGHALKDTGDLPGAAAAYEAAIRVDARERWWRQLLAEVQRRRVLRPRLEAVAGGKAQPASAAEAADFTELCRQPFQKRYAAAARLYAWACAADPS